MLVVSALLSKILNPAPRSKLHIRRIAMQEDPKSSIVWMDMEMTGLDIKKDKILEISCLITDRFLNTIAEGPDLIIYQPDDVLNSMHEWSMQHHAETGLTEQSRNSKITIKDAEDQILEFLKLHIPRRKCPLAGNSIYMDRLFLQQFMPNVDEYLHYRIIDVSTIKELCKRWHPNVFWMAPKKKLKHRSFDDIKDSVQELKYYKENIFGIKF